DAFTIDGIRHNIPFLAALMQHKRWQAGKLSTAFIAEEFPGGFRPLVAEGETTQLLAAVAATIDHVLGQRKRRSSGQRAGQAVMRERKRLVRLGEQEIALDIARDADAIAVRFAGGRKAHALVSPWQPGDPLWSGRYDGRAVSVQVRPVLNGFALAHRRVQVRSYVH